LRAANLPGDSKVDDRIPVRSMWAAVAVNQISS